MVHLCRCFSVFVLFLFLSFISLRFTELKRNYLSETTIDHKQFAVNHKLASTLGNMCVCTPFFHRAWCLVSFVQTTCGLDLQGGQAYHIRSWDVMGEASKDALMCNCTFRLKTVEQAFLRLCFCSRVFLFPPLAILTGPEWNQFNFLKTSPVVWWFVCVWFLYIFTLVQIVLQSLVHPYPFSAVFCAAVRPPLVNMMG